MKKFLPTILWLSCCLITAPIFAYPILLKDGSQIEGSIVGTNGNKVSIETRYGLIEVDKDFVVHASTEQASEISYNPSANAAAVPTMSYRGFRFSVDIYGRGNAYDTIKNTFDSNVRDAAALGHANGSFDVGSTGVGLTAGYVFPAPKEQMLEHGPQIQLLAAPDVNFKVRVTNPDQSVVYTDEADTIHTSMWRLTWQFGVPLKLTDHMYFTPRFDAGALFGRMWFEHESGEDKWSGMTFSASPSLLLGKPYSEKGAHFEVGASYTYIPKKKESDTFDAFQWTAFGIHAGALWFF